MERRVLPQMSEWLANQLHNNPLLSSDDELRLFALTVKADIDFEMDVRPARLDWEQALALAERKNDTKWIRRARTELGFVSFVEGDVSRSLQAVLGGLAAAQQANDVGAQIRYLGALGTGLTLTRSHQAGLDGSGANFSGWAKMGECPDLFRSKSCSPVAISTRRLSCCAYGGT
jgi:hypothetical protein